ncbi:MAG: hypothetical protein KAR06_11010 [Deltaproteobacteria bacterium]|nr:hypothetical protein [Deltaproteobacteria bacterium]
MRDTGGDVKTITGFMPQNDTGGSNVDGAIVDRKGFLSMVATLLFGATTGAPSNIVTVFTLEHGDAANLSDKADVQILATTTVPTAAGGDTVEAAIDLRPLKRYVRIKETTTFTAGTTPAIDLAAAITLGEASVVPAV